MTTKEQIPTVKIDQILSKCSKVLALEQGVQVRFKDGVYEDGDGALYLLTTVSESDGVRRQLVRTSHVQAFRWVANLRQDTDTSSDDGAGHGPWGRFLRKIAKMLPDPRAGQGQALGNGGRPRRS